jgi:hypothetical protein
MGFEIEMKLSALVAAAIFSAAFVLPASAAPAPAPETFPGAPGVITLSGKCARLVVAKFDVTLANGTVTFIFTSDGKALGFQGDGSGIKPASNGNARLPLSLVTTGVGNKMTGQVKVAGFCTFGNPYAGKPFAIECTAESKDSSFTGSFRSGGKLVKKDK